MKRKRIVFKVVLHEGDEFYSAMLGSHRKYSLKYALGKYTIPLVGMIFTFKRLKDAVSFRQGLRYGGKYEILACETSSIHKPNECPKYSDTEWFSEYWKAKTREERLKAHGRYFIPDGTVLCQTIKPIREIKRN